MGDSINRGYACVGFMVVNTDSDINSMLNLVRVVHLFIGTASGGFLCII